jgi:drug/metabolite transporter (DMT)-like permease
MRDAKGYFMIIGAATFWGISATAAKFLLNHNVATILIVQMRVTVSAIVLTLFFAGFRPSALRARLRDLWLFALLGIIGVAGANYTYYFTIKESTVATAILLQYTAPLFVMAYMTMSHGERLTSAKLIAAILSLGGCFLAVGAYDTNVIKLSFTGLISGVGSMLCFAFLNIFSRHILQRHNLWTMTVYSFIFASIFWLIVNPPSVIIEQSPPLLTWGGLIVLAIISVLIPHSLFFSGVRYVGASRAIITSTFEPVVAIASAAALLGELLQPVQVMGAVLVIGAILILRTGREDETLEPQPSGGGRGT